MYGRALHQYSRHVMGACSLRFTTNYALPGCFVTRSFATKGLARPLLSTHTLPRPWKCRSSAAQSPHATRGLHWGFKASPKSSEEEEDCVRDRQEEAAKAAILDKVMKGRQTTDLMLRCEFSPYTNLCNSETLFATFPLQALCWIPQVTSAFIILNTRLWLNDAHSGNVKTISGPFKRSELSSEHKLHVSCAALSRTRSPLSSSRSLVISGR